LGGVGANQLAPMAMITKINSKTIPVRDVGFLSNLLRTFMVTNHLWMVVV
jgi:hypothetical protein